MLGWKGEGSNGTGIRAWFGGAGDVLMGCGKEEVRYMLVCHAWLKAAFVQW